MLLIVCKDQNKCNDIVKVISLLKGDSLNYDKWSNSLSVLSEESRSRLRVSNDAGLKLEEFISGLLSFKSEQVIASPAIDGNQERGEEPEIQLGESGENSVHLAMDNNADLESNNANVRTLAIYHIGREEDNASDGECPNYSVRGVVQRLFLPLTNVVSYCCGKYLEPAYNYSLQKVLDATLYTAFPLAPDTFITDVDQPASKVSARGM